MNFGVTEIEEWLRCRRRWKLGSRNGDNLQKIVPHSTALPLGTVIHASLSKWLKEYKNPACSTLEDLFNEEALIENAKIVKAYRDAHGVGPSAIELEPLHKDLLMGQSMMANYQAYWKAPLPPGFELVSDEQRVRVQIPGTEHTLEGRLDAIIKDIQRENLYVLEHKTYGNRPRDEVLRSNHQFLAYHWLLTQLELGPVGGIAYDGMWKRAAPPKDKVLADLFSRVRIERPPHEIAEFEQMLAWTVNEMADNPPIYINRTWDGSCHWGCAFSELCLTMSRGEDTEYMRRTLYMPKPDTEEKTHELAS